jgi:hypothetical protein
MPEIFTCTTVKWENHYYDVVHSPDDGGWYVQRWSDNKTSEIYPDKESAKEALYANKIEWG